MSPSLPAPWSLHPQLDADSLALADLPLCRVQLANDANYPWLILVPRRFSATEIIDLDAADRARLMVEIDMTARALRATVPCDKLNIAALGNMVPQLHVHIIARRTTDPAWPRPVWGAVAARAYDPPALSALVAALRGYLTPDAPP